MIRAGAGLWINYATTLVFQVALAARLGTGTSAAVFAITFSIVIAVAGIVSATAQSVIVPRLVDADGSLVTHVSDLLTRVVVVGATPLVALTIIPGELAHVLAPWTGLSESPLSDALRFGALFALIQIVAGALIVVAIARGARFAPAVAPAAPSIAGAVLFVLTAHPTVRTVFVYLCWGSVVEVGFLALASLRRLKFSSSEPASARALSFATAGQLALLSVVPPLERILASRGSVSGAADYNYAVRSLSIVQQLLVGGLLLAALGDWSRFNLLATPRRVAAGVGRAVLLAFALLAGAAIVGAVFRTDLVALAYQRGSFSAHDTNVVAWLMLLALPGFVGEGVGLVVSQAVVAARQNWVAIRIGVSNFAARCALVVFCGLAWGAAGVAVAYSVVTVAVCVVQLLVAHHLGLIQFSTKPADSVPSFPLSRA